MYYMYVCRFICIYIYYCWCIKCSVQNQLFDQVSTGVKLALDALCGNLLKTGHEEGLHPLEIREPVNMFSNNTDNALIHVVMTTVANMCANKGSVLLVSLLKIN